MASAGTWCTPSPASRRYEAAQPVTGRPQRAKKAGLLEKLDAASAMRSKGRAAAHLRGRSVESLPQPLQQGGHSSLPRHADFKLETRRRVARGHPCALPGGPVSEAGRSRVHV
jgi:hypothetical protein